jgi:hypothetical protein
MHTLRRPAALPHIAGRPQWCSVCELLVNRSEEWVIVTLATGLCVVKSVLNEASEWLARGGRLLGPECGFPFFEPFALRFQCYERVSHLRPAGSSRNNQFPQLSAADCFAHLSQLSKTDEQVVSCELALALVIGERL